MSQRVEGKLMGIVVRDAGELQSTTMSNGYHIIPLWLDKSKLSVLWSLSGQVAVSGEKRQGLDLLVSLNGH